MTSTLQHKSNTTLSTPYHIPALVEECIEGLLLKPGGVYVDVTFGGGGHSEHILHTCPDCSLIAFDQDPDAALKAKKITHQNFTFIESNFRFIKNHLKAIGIHQIDGLLADLGVSSHQIDTPERGFSTRFAAPLDMRMDKENQCTAAHILNTYPEKKLQHIFSQFGEVRNAKTLASVIEEYRKHSTISTTEQFIKILSPLAPKGREYKYYAQVFQALRIEVNQELEALKDLLTQSAELLVPGGRLLVISYHSLEDRMVKNFIAKGTFGEEIKKDIYGNFYKPFHAVNKKPIEPSEYEIQNNPRVRSAKLRIAEKI
ncbi:MAG: 16S rRNA (cytosine(1402)-N(4))-methyltransferase RsmH [Cytophagaceae bacterium]|nr:16S rRNA (cytosine(1402)-N(4))-methyltransferase RsmH [Cytophagaceae bacterium]MDW8455426.1 16S rRNA (cytosine(1402)-N(4))-methyltransferase RsmH [Cytophagaceae bacterium]